MPLMIPIDQFRVLLLDMNSTFMFGEDRFGRHENFEATYRAQGGRALTGHEVDGAIRAAYAFLHARYADPAYEDDFPSLAEAFAAVAPEVASTERARLEQVFAQHELGTVPPEHARALGRLHATHELRLLTNIWAPKKAWLSELSNTNILPLFAHTVFSSDTRSVKPSLRLTRLALEGIQCRLNQVLMVGDSLERDMVAGRRAGLTTAFVTADRTVPATARALVDYEIPSLLALVESSSPTAPAA